MSLRFREINSFKNEIQSDRLLISTSDLSMCTHMYTCTYTRILELRVSVTMNCLLKRVCLHNHSYWTLVLSLVLLQNPVTGIEKNVVINEMCSQFTLVSWETLFYCSKFFNTKVKLLRLTPSFKLALFFQKLSFAVTFRVIQ